MAAAFLALPGDGAPSRPAQLRSAAAATAPSQPPPVAPVGADGSGGAALLIPGAAVACAAAAARAGNRQTRRRAAVRRRADTTTMEAPAVEVDAVAEPPAAASDSPVGGGVTLASEASEGRLNAIPFLPEPAYRRYVTNVPGDAGFDPLGLAGASPETFKDMLEAETKHGRVAMLAWVGIVLPEMFHTRIAEALNLDDLLVDGCVPTLQNGGLAEPEVAIGLAVAWGLFSAAEVLQPNNRGLPGYFGFDPLNVGDVEISEFGAGLVQSGAPWVAEAEAKHGRVAMLAVTYCVLREFFTGVPSVGAV